jgi:hypothetical protein
MDADALFLGQRDDVRMLVAWDAVVPPMRDVASGQTERVGGHGRTAKKLDDAAMFHAIAPLFRDMPLCHGMRMEEACEHEWSCGQWHFPRGQPTVRFPPNCPGSTPDDD